MQRAPVLTSGIVLAGTYPWANSAFDQLSLRPLVPVAHRPLISFALSWLQNGGIRNVVVCGNRNCRGLEAPVRRQFGQELDLNYLEDPMPRGAAGCVRDAALQSDSQTFVVTDSSAIPNIDLAHLLETHWDSGAVATVVVHPEAIGAGESMLRVPTGVYVFDRRVLEPIARQGFVDIKEHLIPRLVRQRERVAMFVATDAAPRVLDADTYLAVNDFATQTATVKDRSSAPGVFIRWGDALIHQEATIASDVVLAGPVLIGPGANLRSGVVVIGPSSIGCDVTIDDGALVSRSAVWRRAHVQSRAVVDRSIIADDAVVMRDAQEYGSVVVSGRKRLARALAPHQEVLGLAGTDGRRKGLSA